VAAQAAINPHEIMIRAIHRLAPTRSISQLLGTSNNEYPIKKMPAPNPNALELKLRSRFIWRAASATLERSTKLKT